MEFNLSEYIEKELVSKRFILTLIIVLGYLCKPDVVPAEIFVAVVMFYFGSHVSTGSQDTIIESEPIRGYTTTLVGDDTKT